MEVENKGDWEKEASLKEVFGSSQAKARRAEGRQGRLLEALQGGVGARGRQGGRRRRFVRASINDYSIMGWV